MGEKGIGETLTVAPRFNPASTVSTEGKGDATMPGKKKALGCCRGTQRRTPNRVSLPSPRPAQLFYDNKMGDTTLMLRVCNAHKRDVGPGQLWPHWQGPRRPPWRQPDRWRCSNTIFFGAISVTRGTFPPSSLAGVPHQLCLRSSLYLKHE